MSQNETQVVVHDAGPPPRVPPELAAHVRTAIARWSLTKRQGEALDPLVLGASNKEMAHTLGCALKTVEIHVSAILRKGGRGHASRPDRGLLDAVAPHVGDFPYGS